MSRKNRVVARRFALCLIAVIAAACLLAGYAREKSRAQAQEKRIRELVTVGMDIDEAVGILRDEGIDFSEKYAPTAARDYWVVHIPIRKKIPLSATINEVTGMSLSDDPKVCVNLVADKNGVIYSIE